MEAIIIILMLLLIIIILLLFLVEAILKDRRWPSRLI